MTEDISSIIVTIDKCLQNLKLESRGMTTANKEKMVQNILEMRWQLARALSFLEQTK